MRQVGKIEVPQQAFLGSTQVKRLGIMVLLDGKALKGIIQKEIKAEVESFISSGQRAPHLAAVLVGNDGASQTYVNHKVKLCEKVGFKSTLISLDENTSQSELLDKIHKLNKDKAIDGFIVQLPLPNHIDVNTVTNAINPAKDVDGFHPTNVGRMSQNMPSYLPATPYGIMQILDRYGVETVGKHCVIIGRSNIVGTPMGILLSRNSNPGNCTVTICHSRTRDLKSISLEGDIIIAALGKPGFLSADMVKPGAAVIDVGITRVKDNSKKSGYRLRGDVDFDNVAPKCSFITPVPGGVGPMTVISLLKNTLKAAKNEIY